MLHLESASSPVVRRLLRFSSHNAFSRHTSSHFLRRDQERGQALLDRQFDVGALETAAATSAGSSGVLHTRKPAEGRSNKTFKVQLTNRKEVIARVPTPLAGPAHLVTASEVATMRFLRERLGLTQVPRVLSWSSQASDTPVGAEYIVMDVADGVELRQVWHDLKKRQKLEVVKAWVDFESKMLEGFSGGGYGSLYYRKDLPAELRREILVDGEKDGEFVLGPSTVRSSFWEDEYGPDTDIELDRGPWPDMPPYLKSIAVAPWEPPAHLSVPQDHLRLLDMYEKVVNYLIPEDERAVRPAILHRNSHWGNIFLSQEALSRNGTIEISAVTDWQHTGVLPLYLTADFPRFIEKLEQGPDQEDEAFSKEVAILRECYHALYRDAGYGIAWASAIPYGTNFSMARYLPDAASSCWHGGQVKLKSELIRAARNWEKVAGPDVACPLGPSPFSGQEIARAEAEQSAWQEADTILHDMATNIGVKAVDGWVRAEEYDRALQASGRLRDGWVEVWKECIAKDDKHRLSREVDPACLWPFDVPAPGEATSKQ